MYKTIDGKWHDGQKEFYDVKKAERFIRSINSKSTSYVTSWGCDDPYDNEYLNRKNLLWNPLKGGL